MDRQLGRFMAIHDVRVVHVVLVMPQSPFSDRFLLVAVLDVLPANRRHELVVAFRIGLVPLGQLATASLEPVLELLIKLLDLVG